MERELMIDRVREHLESNGIRFNFEEERQIFRFGITTHNKIRSLNMVIHFTSQEMVVLAVCPLAADVASADEVMRYLTMANYGLRNGNFEMDLNDGEVRYKSYVNTEGYDELPDCQIRKAVVIPVAMFDRFGDGLAALLMGFSDATTEMRKVKDGEKAN